MAILTCLSPSLRQMVETSLKSGGPIVFFSLAKVRKGPIRRAYGRLLLRKSVSHGISFRRSLGAMARLTMMMRSIELKVW